MTEPRKLTPEEKKAFVAQEKGMKELKIHLKRMKDDKRTGGVSGKEFNKKSIRDMGPVTQKNFKDFKPEQTGIPGALLAAGVGAGEKLTDTIVSSVPGLGGALGYIKTRRNIKRANEKQEKERKKLSDILIKASAANPVGSQKLRAAFSKSYSKTKNADVSKTYDALIDTLIIMGATTEEEIVSLLETFSDGNHSEDALNEAIEKEIEAGGFKTKGGTFSKKLNSGRSVDGSSVSSTKPFSYDSKVGIGGGADISRSDSSRGELANSYGMATETDERQLKLLGGIYNLLEKRLPKPDKLQDKENRQEGGKSRLGSGGALGGLGGGSDGDGGEDGGGGLGMDDLFMASTLMGGRGGKGRGPKRGKGGKRGKWSKMKGRARVGMRRGGGKIGRLLSLGKTGLKGAGLLAAGTGIGSMIGSGASSAASGVGNMASSAASGVGNMASSAASGVGRAASGVAGAGGGFFSNIGSGIGNLAKGAWGGVKGAAQGVGGLVKSGANLIGNLSPMKYVTGLVKRGGPKLLKLGTKIPVIGTAIEALLGAYAISSIKSDPTLSKKEKKKLIGEQIGYSLGSIIGMVGGGALGTMLFPFGGTLVGAFLGSMGGGWLGEKLAGAMGGETIYNALSGVPLLGSLLSVGDDAPSESDESSTPKGSISPSAGAGKAKVSHMKTGTRIPFMRKKKGMMANSPLTSGTGASVLTAGIGGQSLTPNTSNPTLTTAASAQITSSQSASAARTGSRGNNASIVNAPTTSTSSNNSTTINSIPVGQSEATFIAAQYHNGSQRF